MSKERKARLLRIETNMETMLVAMFTQNQSLENQTLQKTQSGFPQGLALSHLISAPHQFAPLKFHNWDRARDRLCSRRKSPM